jgi:hypothetical protein
MLKSRHCFIIMVSILILLALVMASLSCISIHMPSLSKSSSATQKATQSTSGPTRLHPLARTGEYTLGTKVDAASQSIGKIGGGIIISKPGDPLDGFTLGVPPGAYPDSRTFKVSYAPITKHTFGNDITPVSPMIMVDNGGGYSNELICVKVPVKVPDGYFAMGFLYDEKTKQLEGMPLIASDANSVTVVTRHFSNFLITMTAKALLKNDIDTGFCPGIDDFQFVNNGSFIAPNGHCSGQSLVAMWYYCTNPDGKDACLYGRYDNNGNKPATPAIWQDDSQAYRLCSVVQTYFEGSFADNFWLNLQGKNFVFKNNNWQLENVPGLDDETRYYLFAYSMMATHEPQYVSLLREGGGHAVIAYKILGNAIYIADPNYPGVTDRKIIYYSGDRKFKPYQSGANRKEIEKGNTHTYTNIGYSGKSTVSNWPKIASYWAELKNGTVGNDKFPQYTLTVEDSTGKRIPLVDGFTTTKKEFSVRVDLDPAEWRFYRDGAELKDKFGVIELKPDNNLLGIYIAKMASATMAYEYVDFKYFNVKYDDEECTSGWILQSVTPKIIKGTGPNVVNFTQQEGSYSCSEISKGEGSPSYTATSTATGSWTSLPKCIKPDEKKPVTLSAAITFKIQPQVQWGGFSNWMYIRDGMTELAEINLRASSDSVSPPQTKTVNIYFPGKAVNGAEREITVTFKTGGGQGEYRYKYVYKN